MSWGVTWGTKTEEELLAFPCDRYVEDPRCGILPRDNDSSPPTSHLSLALPDARSSVQL